MNGNSPSGTVQCFPYNVIPVKHGCFPNSLVKYHLYLKGLDRRVGGQDVDNALGRFTANRAKASKFGVLVFLLTSAIFKFYNCQDLCPWESVNFWGIEKAFSLIPHFTKKYCIIKSCHDLDLKCCPKGPMCVKGNWIMEAAIADLLLTSGAWLESGHRRYDLEGYVCLLLQVLPSP